MARGTESKESIKNTILQTFEGSFLYDGGKEIRIPMIEDGAEIQIKVTLTAAKTNVRGNTAEDRTTPKQPQPAEITSEEKEAVKTLLHELGVS